MNKKIKIAGLILTIPLATGCGRDEKVDGHSDRNADSVPAATNTATAPVQSKSSFAKGIKLSFDHDVQQDRIREVKEGDFQRRVRVEYIGLDQQQAITAVTADAITAGYALVESQEMGEGAVRLRFKPEKGPRISATVRQGGDLQHPSARGTIQFNIPVEAPTK